MTDQRSFARTVMALSSVVIAVCAVVVTVYVTTLDPVPVEPPRVLDQAALEKQVAGAAGGLKKTPWARVDCPLSIVVKDGTEFDCTVYGDTNPKRVTVEILDDQGKLTVQADN
ncbi:DUF4333 domain-containing protein [Streptomyces sp. NPDC006012]|uniref:DUF4333 domain-containing protein n=1 Tax=Streptomyces sp. NPDC006012 TaxID=3364739 RepID=UPI00369C6EA6